jgi:hypothetical protein
MRSALPVALVLVSVAALGCTPARYRGAEDRELAHGTISEAPGPDAWMAEPEDGGTVVPREDAWVMPGHDAAVVVAPDDASTATCPTYGGDVQPIYVMHCANCHTTGGDPHFGSSYTVANRASSSCGTSEAACTIQLGRPGGSMARRDALGGFSTSEIRTLQSWIDCGRPM